MARGAGCCGNCCSCCLWAAVSLPPLFYHIVFSLLCAGILGAGVYFFIFAIQFSSSVAGALISKEIFIGSLVVGGVLTLLGGYGLVGVGFNACKGSKDVHLKTHYLISLVIVLVLVVFTVVCFLNASDNDNIDVMLDYGWSKAFLLQKNQAIISRAQVDALCCGFASPSDRAVQPCPSNANGGCQPHLRESLKMLFGLAGIIFAASAGGVFLNMGATHGWIERLTADRMKAASGGGSDDSRWSLLDAGRQPKGLRQPVSGIPERYAPGVLPPATFSNGLDPGEDGIEGRKKGR